VVATLPGQVCYVVVLTPLIAHILQRPRVESLA
jgi:hypothetical protein